MSARILEVQNCELNNTLPSIPTKPSTPCKVCPKWKLFPENYGLDPANELAVEIYRMCREPQRVGTFAGAFLLRTVTVNGVLTMLDEFDDAFATSIDRRQTLIKVMAIDRVATEVQGGREEAMRAVQEAVQKSKQMK